MVSGTVGSSGSVVRRGGVLGVEIGAGAGWSGGNLLSTVSGLNGISPVGRKAERTVAAPASAYLMQ